MSRAIIAKILSKKFDYLVKKERKDGYLKRKGLIFVNSVPFSTYIAFLSEEGGPPRPCFVSLKALLAVEGEKDKHSC